MSDTKALLISKPHHVLTFTRDRAWKSLREADKHLARLLTKEAELMERARGALPESMGVKIPRVFNLDSARSLAVLEMEFVAGSNCHNFKVDPARFRRVAETLSLLGERTRTQAEGEDAEFQSVWAAARDLEILPQLQPWLDRIPKDRVLVHGDLSYQNILVSPTTMAWVDWELGSLAGFPLSDFFDFWLYALYQEPRNYTRAFESLSDRGLEVNRVAGEALAPIVALLGREAVESLFAASLLRRVSVLKASSTVKSKSKIRDLSGVLKRFSSRPDAREFIARS